MVNRKPNPWWVWLLPLPVVWWAAVLLAGQWMPGMDLAGLLGAMTAALREPMALRWSSQAPRFLLLFTVAYGFTAAVIASDRKNTRYGEEHGSAKWGNVREMARRYRDKPANGNILLTKHFQIGIDGYKHKHNTNVLVVGGSGAGKTRTYCVPNVLECACSMVITDPKAEILRKTGALLQAKGYEVRVFDLISPETSFCYNPFSYVHNDREVLQLITNLIQNTTPPESHSNDPFWESATRSQAVKSLRTSNGFPLFGELIV